MILPHLMPTRCGDPETVGIIWLFGILPSMGTALGRVLERIWFMATSPLLSEGPNLGKMAT